MNPITAASELCVDLAISALTVDPNHGEIKPFVDVHARAVDLRVRAVSFVTFKHQLRLRPGHEIPAFASGELAPKTEPAEDDIFAQPLVADNILVRVAILRNDGIAGVWRSVEAAGRKRDAEAVMRSGLAVGATIARRHTAGAVVPVNRLPATVWIGFMGIVKHRNPFAIPLSDVDQVVVHIVVVRKLSQVWLAPMYPILRFRIRTKRRVRCAFMVVEFERLQATVSRRGQIPHPEDPAFIVKQRRAIHLAPALPILIRVYDRIPRMFFGLVGMFFGLVDYPSKSVNPFD